MNQIEIKNKSINKLPNIEGRAKTHNSMKKLQNVPISKGSDYRPLCMQYYTTAALCTIGLWHVNLMACSGGPGLTNHASATPTQAGHLTNVAVVERLLYGPCLQNKGQGTALCVLIGPSHCGMDKPTKWTAL